MLEVYGITDKGLVRKQNEDRIYITNKSGINLYIIADGMGGANAGEVASKKCVEFIKQYIFKNYTKNSVNEIKDLINSAIDYANKKVYSLSMRNKDYEGMGTTVIVLLVIENKIYIGHVGDSSLFRKRKKIIRKITKDHTYVQKLIDDKTITKQEAKVHPKRHMITKVLGCDEVLEPDIIIKKIENDDYIIMCTDGLTNLVKDREILNIVEEKKSCKQISKELIKLSIDRGGYDNISVIVLKYNNGGI